VARRLSRQPLGQILVKTAQESLGTTVDYTGRLDLFKLDSRGNERVSECLSNGKTLAHRLVNTLEISKGTTYAIADREASEEQLYHFEWGGIVPQIPREKWLHGKNGSLFQEVVTIDNLLAKVMEQRLSRTKSLLIVQHWYGSPEDPWLVDEQRRPWIFGKEIYFASTQPTQKDVFELFRLASDHWPGTLGIVSDFRMPDLPKDIDYIMDSEIINGIVSKTREVLIGAYDGESYLLWTLDDWVVDFYRTEFASFGK
jgi:hypothetical protein